jgi:ABC-2 type transport system permease protein
MTRSGGFLRLVGAELTRLRSRRLTPAAALLVLLAVGLFQIAVNDEVSPPSAADVTQQRQYYEQAHQEWEQGHAAQEKDCQDSGQSQQDCVWPEPTPADYSLTASAFADVAPTAVQLSAYVALLAAFLVGASFIGAEYSTGSLANWLTFVPQRLRVYGSKLVAVVLASAVGGAGASFVMLGLVALLTHLHGGGLTGLGAVAATAGRAVPVAVLAGVAGFTLALLTRYTVAALGVALGYLVASAVIGTLASNADGPLGWLPPWLPENNVAAFLEHGTTYTQYVLTVTASGTSGDSVEKHLSFGHSAVYWLVLLVVAVVSGALVFRRRDVT